MNSRPAMPPPAFPSRRSTMSNSFRRRLPDRSCGVSRSLICGCASSVRSKSRLTESDRVVLGGLVEGTWPPESNNDAWLSRPMRLELGLDLPERRIGLSAHDFAQLLGAPEVILSHAAKIAGTPTVPSRFVQRLAAISGTHWQDAVKRGETYLAWARELDRPEQVTPAPRPAPTPPRAARPKGLSVTEIEDWLRDPYTIYAKHVLRLKPLDAVDTEPGAAERGTIIHAAVGAFTQKFAAGLPADPAERTHRAGRAALCRARGFSRGARILVAALSAHCALVHALGRRAARRHRRADRRNPGRDRYRARRRHVPPPRHRRPYRTRRRRPLPSFSITRPAPYAARSRYAPDWRRSSRWKPRYCAAGVLPASPPGARSARSPM